MLGSDGIVLIFASIFKAYYLRPAIIAKENFEKPQPWNSAMRKTTNL